MIWCSNPRKRTRSIPPPTGPRSFGTPKFRVAPLASSLAAPAMCRAPVAANGASSIDRRLPDIIKTEIGGARRSIFAATDSAATTRQGIKSIIAPAGHVGATSRRAPCLLDCRPALMRLDPR